MVRYLPVLRKPLVFLVAFVALFSFAACSSVDEQASVKTYNNSVVTIQKAMLQKAQDSSKIFQEAQIDNQKILLTLQGIHNDILNSYKQFQDMVVPKGAEPIADAMEKFFQVETGGLDDIISGFQNFQKNQSDPAAVAAFTATLKSFTDRESAALEDFYAIQQQVAAKYGQKVGQTME